MRMEDRLMCEDQSAIVDWLRNNGSTCYVAEDGVVAGRSPKSPMFFNGKNNEAVTTIDVLTTSGLKAIRFTSKEAKYVAQELQKRPKVSGENTVDLLEHLQKESQLPRSE